MSLVVWQAVKSQERNFLNLINSNKGFVCGVDTLLVVGTVAALIQNRSLGEVKLSSRKSPHDCIIASARHLSAVSLQRCCRLCALALAAEASIDLNSSAISRRELPPLWSFPPMANEGSRRSSKDGRSNKATSLDAEIPLLLSLQLARGVRPRCIGILLRIQLPTKRERFCFAASSDPRHLSPLCCSCGLRAGSPHSCRSCDHAASNSSSSFLAMD